MERDDDEQGASAGDQVVPGHVLLLAPIPPSRVLGDDVEVVTPTTRADAVAAAAGAVACVAHWDGTGITVDEEIAAALAPTCRLVQVPAAGLDGIDENALRAAGIPISSARGLNDVAVAEWVVWAIVDALRGLSDAHAQLRRGGWRTTDRRRLQLRGRRVGIVGMGAVGHAVLPLLRPFGVELRYWSRSRHEDVEAAGVSRLALDELVAASDVLVLAVALTPDTRRLLTAELIASMPADAVVVNAARAEIWDPAAIAASVAGEDGLLAAATDVFTDEPACLDDPVVGVDGITTTPHLAGPTTEVVRAILALVAENLATARAGGTPQRLL